jgi:hypothetical protein
MAGAVLPAGSTNTQGLAPWAGDYITDYLGKAKALSEKPYEVYKGPLSAGASDLQNQAFQGIGSLTVPGSIGQAAGTAGDIASKAQNMNYAPTQFTNQFNAPGAYQGAAFGNQFQAPAQSAATNFTNQFQAPDQYQNTAFTSGTFGGQQAQQYMNPYLQTSLNPQLAEARRQSDITAQQNNAAMTKAGAFGGGRQAILTSENQRNLGTNLANITGQGYNTAYQNAMSQYNADQARNMQAQQASEQSKQFGAGQSMTAAQMMAQYGMSAQQAQEAARQFNQQQAMTGAQSSAQYGLAGRQAEEASRQFGAQQGMTAAQQAAQYGQAAQTASEQSRQFGAQQGLAGLNTALSAAQAQGNLGSLQNQTNLANLSAQLTAGGQQRGISSEDIAARQAEFNQQRQYPFQQIQFQRDMIAGLPTGQVSNNAASLTGMGAFLSSLGGGTAAATALGYKDVGELLRGLGLDFGKP